MEPSIEAPTTDNLKEELRKLALSVADKKEEDLTEEERRSLDEGVDGLTEFTKGLTDLAMPGIELIAADISDCKKKINELQIFCEKIENFQVEYSKKVAMAFLEIIEVIEGTRTISPTWKDNLRKKAGIEEPK